MKLEHLEALNAARRERRAAVLATRLADGAQRFVAAADIAADPLAEPLEAALRSGKSATIEHEGEAWFLTVEVPAVRLVMIGAVHISQALAPVARIAGLDPIVIDPRTAFASPERFPDTPVLAQWPDEALEAQPLDAFTAIALLTHDPKIDDRALTRALKADCFYIGALGSRRRTRAGSTGCARKVSTTRRWRASTRRSASTSAPSAPPKSRWRSAARSSRPSARNRCARAPRREIRRGQGREAAGAISAHAVQTDGLVLRKGQEVTPRVQAELKAAGVETLIAAELEPGDVGEDVAATRLAARISGPGLKAEKAFTGRVNLFAAHAGLLEVDVGAVDAINEIDEAITVATLPAWKAVAAGDMAATVKIIPFAASSASLSAAEAIAADHGAVRVRPFRKLGVAMVSTLAAGSQAERRRQDGAGDGGAARATQFAARLRSARASRNARFGAGDQEAAAQAVLVVVFGASAITDRRDVIPSALEAAGGQIEHFGMPVDPGNLLLIGDLSGKPVIGAPGCARSPKENGFDWVLQRLIAGAPIGRREIQRMGVGGLLMEISSRPQPRSGDE